MRCRVSLILSLAAAALSFLLGSSSSSLAAEAISPAPATAMPPAKDLAWQDDYRTAVNLASEANQLLLVWFHDETKTAENEKFEKDVLAADILRPVLDQLTCVKLSTQAALDLDGKAAKLLKHRSFAELAGGPGLALIDFRDEDAKHHGWVVSIYPSRRGITPAKLKLMCELPPGTLTQRTLIFAVRTHPAAPASAWSPHSNYLTKEAEKHSLHQASILLQGHHNWESRFHQINAGLGIGGAKEVCAESWVGQSLFDAAEECVDSWSQSSGHWASVSARHSYFGYDMKRGTNGVWYATGIFAGR